LGIKDIVQIGLVIYKINLRNDFMRKDYF